MKRLLEKQEISYGVEGQANSALEKPKNVPSLETVLSEAETTNSEAASYLQELFLLAGEYQKVLSEHQAAHADFVKNKLFLDTWYYGPSIYYMLSRLMEQKVNVNTIPEAAGISLIMWIVLLIINALAYTPHDKEENNAENDEVKADEEVVETAQPVKVPTQSLSDEDEPMPTKDTSTSYRDFAYRRAKRAWLAKKKVRLAEKVDILAEELGLYETKNMVTSTPDTLVPKLLKYKLRRDLLLEASRKHRLEDKS